MTSLDRRSALLLITAGAGLALAGCAPTLRPQHLATAATLRRTPTPTPSPSATPAYDLTAHSIDDPRSIWLVVNKRRPLRPKTWVPPDLVDVDVPHTNAPQMRKGAAKAVERMFAAADDAHVHLISISAYRPYDDQRSIFDSDLNNLGRKGAEALTLRPGYSEHQTGLAIDIGASSEQCSLNACFGTMSEGEWLAEHAWKYGFLLRYPKPDEHITGIEYEPWHFRYVGKSLAKHLHETHIATLEQLFGLPDAPTYA